MLFRKIVLMSFSLLIIFQAGTMAKGPVIGSVAPAFDVVSGADVHLLSADLKGKVVVILYETKDVAEKNRRLKNALNKYFQALVDDLKKNLFALPVIDCTGAYFPFVGIWKQQLVKASQKEGLTIFGDWDGRMQKAYQAVDNDANVYLIDKSGSIRYFISGQVDDKAIAGIIGQIDQLLK